MVSSFCRVPWGFAAVGNIHLPMLTDETKQETRVMDNAGRGINTYTVLHPSVICSFG